MPDQPEPWQSDPEAEARFARRAGYGPRPQQTLVTSWWWYGLVTLQFWWRVAVWVLGERAHAATSWAVGSSVGLIVLTPLFVFVRRKARGRTGVG